jgi:protein required for attachment to host cells
MSLHPIFEHPAGRLQAGEIDADRPGRVPERRGDQRHGVGREESGVAHVTAGFTCEMADFLRSSRLNLHYDQLVLVAGPKLLGGLRQALDRDTAAPVSASLPKDLLQGLRARSA